ncbi:MAG: hypothetical protein HYV63_27655 [Candidatus Schekmanbacteria bacterium]|nr:hypothetical protein [Candidatus Schekmanbacteria bacterium]
MAIVGRTLAVEPTPLVAPTPAREEPWVALQANQDRFDRELRGAFARHDAAAMALLVKFPLRINHPDFSITSLENPRALENGFDQAFPPELRERVLKSTRDNLTNYEEMPFANGLLWAYPTGPGETGFWRIQKVNLPRPEADPKKPAPLGLEFTCETEKQRIVVESNSHSAAVVRPRIRYRAWDKPRFLPDVPDMDVSGGEWDIRGTGRCSDQVFSFVKGDTKYELSELGCTSAEDMPRDVTGYLDVSVGDNEASRAWCF